MIKNVIKGTQLSTVVKILEGTVRKLQAKNKQKQKTNPKTPLELIKTFQNYES